MPPRTPVGGSSATPTRPHQHRRTPVRTGADCPGHMRPECHLTSGLIGSLSTRPVTLTSARCDQRPQEQVLPQPALLTDPTPRNDLSGPLQRTRFEATG